MYEVHRDEHVEQQVSALPAEALAAYAEARTVLELQPWAGEPVNAHNPDGPVRTLVFDGSGLITYLILDDQRRVEELQVLWIG